MQPVQNPVGSVVGSSMTSMGSSSQQRIDPWPWHRSAGNHRGIPRQQPGDPVPEEIPLICYRMSDPAAGSTATPTLGRSTAIRCGIQCQQEARACASTRTDPLQSGAGRSLGRAGAQSRSAAIRRGIRRPELSPEGSQRPAPLRYHPAAGDPSRSAAIHPGMRRRRRDPVGRSGGSGVTQRDRDRDRDQVAAVGAQGQPPSRRLVPTFSCSFSISSLCASSDSSSTRRCAVSFFRNSISLRGPARGGTSPPPLTAPQRWGVPAEVGQGRERGDGVSGRNHDQWRGGDCGVSQGMVHAQG